MGAPEEGQADQHYGRAPQGGRDQRPLQREPASAFSMPATESIRRALLPTAALAGITVTALGHELRGAGHETSSPAEGAADERPRAQEAAAMSTAITATTSDLTVRSSARQATRDLGGTST